MKKELKMKLKLTALSLAIGFSTFQVNASGKTEAEVDTTAPALRPGEVPAAYQEQAIAAQEFKDHHQRWWFDNVKHSKCFMS